MIGRVLACLLGVMACGSARAEVVISEVMADPTGSEFRNEFVELTNTGDSAVDLAGWSIGDGTSTDRLVFTGTSVVEPGGYCLIVDPDYDEGDRPYGAWPDVPTATVEDRAIGSAGLANGTPETVSLRDPDGRVVSEVRYAVGHEGFSYERVLGDPDESDTWLPSKWQGGTPGRVNSVSRKRVDLSISVRTPEEWTLAAGHDAQADVTVANLGTAAAAGRLTVMWGDGEIAQETGVLAAGDRRVFAVDLPDLPGRTAAFEARVETPGDEDPTNDGVSWSIQYGIAPGTVVINELMPAPERDGEWVELLNRTPSLVSLVGWHLVDASGRAGNLPDTSIAAGGLLVMAEDAVKGAVVSPWPSLNNGGDTVRLIDLAGTVVDSVAYEDSRSGRSIERIDPDGPSGDPANWLVNAIDPGGTPGRENRASKPPVGAAIVADPDPFDDETTISADLLDSRSFVTLHVYDRRGRLRRRLLDGVESGPTLRVRWDARDDAGRLVRPGTYVLVVESSGNDGRVTRSRGTVTFAKGL